MGLIAAIQQKKLQSCLNRLGDFSPTQQFLSVDGTTGIALDGPRRAICLLGFEGATWRQLGTATARIIAYEDVLSSEVFEDGMTIIKTQRPVNIGGAILGALLLGGAGMIVGGLSGWSGSSSHGKVTRVDLRMIVNDTDNPLHDVNFLSTETNKQGILGLPYQVAIKQARFWHGLLEVIIEMAKAEDAIRTTPSEPAPSSAADEIRKLVDLRDDGTLSEDEFESLKKRIVNG